MNFLCTKILNFSVFLFCRGFGFVTFTDAASVDKVLAQQHHELDSKTVSLCFLHLHKSFIHVLSLMCFANCDVFFPFCLGLPGQAPIKVNRLLQSKSGALAKMCTSYRKKTWMYSLLLVWLKDGADTPPSFCAATCAASMYLLWAQKSALSQSSVWSLLMHRSCA